MNVLVNHKIPVDIVLPFSFTLLMRLELILSVFDVL